MHGYETKHPFPVTLSRNADCLILVGEGPEQRAFEASSHVVREMGPLLEPQFIHYSADNKSPFIDLSSQCAQSFEILLNIAHLKFHSLPVKLTFNQLFRLATTIHDNEISMQIRSRFIDPWVESLMAETESFGCEKWLKIATNLGCCNILDRATRDIALNTKFVGGNLTFMSETQSSFLVPQDILESIGIARTLVMRSLLTGVLTVLAKPSMDRGGCTSKSRGASGEKSMCNAILTGSIVNGLCSLGAPMSTILSPDGDLSDLDGFTIQELAEGLQSIEIHAYGGKGNHNSCAEALDLEELVEEVLENFPTVLPDGHPLKLRTMEQAGKL